MEIGKQVDLIIFMKKGEREPMGKDWDLTPKIEVKGGDILSYRKLNQRSEEMEGLKPPLGQNNLTKARGSRVMKNPKGDLEALQTLEGERYKWKLSLAS